MCSNYEFARECKFIRYCINQHKTLNLLLKAKIKSTPLNLQTSIPRVHFAEIKSARQQRDKITIQRNSACQHKAMTSVVIAQKMRYSSDNGSTWKGLVLPTGVYNYSNAFLKNETVIEPQRATFNPVNIYQYQANENETLKQNNQSDFKGF